MDDQILKAKEFLKISDQFRLGKLSTEGFHPKTKNLSQLAETDLIKAWSLLRSIDLAALEQCSRYADYLDELTKDIQNTFKAGHKVFLCGCGATGRLSIVLETILKKDSFKYADQVISFMAGGDVALIKSIENFEDYPHYGKRQLEELAYTKDDLLIAITEGGETPFVIGAAQASASKKAQTYFIYCNEDNELKKSAQRCRDVLDNKNIKKISIPVGEMALSGSTRMQATTVQMLFVGFALQNFKMSFKDYISKLKFKLENLDIINCVKFSEYESNLYLTGKKVIYTADAFLASSVLTDTTERSPTFNLNPFESYPKNSGEKSLCYLHLKGAKESGLAWESLLEREPRTLEWEETKTRSSLSILHGHDISNKILEYRKKQESIEISFTKKQISIHYLNNSFIIDSQGLDSLQTHLLLKMFLNTHSTLVMGRLGRYHGNMMTWVKPSNNKLIDRAIRYAQNILELENYNPSYEELVYLSFEQLDQLNSDASFVKQIVKAWKKGHLVSA